MSPDKPKILFVTGTDTGVGKTTVACALLSELCERGFSPRTMKPVETGCERLVDGSLRPKDAEALLLASGGAQSLGEVCPCRFEHPVAPLVAAEAVCEQIETSKLIQDLKAIVANGEFVVVEGAGGLLVPLREAYTFADFVKDCDAAVLVVVGSKLGALNQALLTFEVLRNRSIPVVGYVLNEFTTETEEPAAKPGAVSARSTNRNILKRLAIRYGVDELSYFSHQSSRESDLERLRARRGPESLLGDHVVEYFGLHK